MITSNLVSSVISLIGRRRLDAPLSEMFLINKEHLNKFP